MQNNLTKAGPKLTDPKIRFWRFVRKTPTCWEWTAYIHPTGYGVLSNRRRHFIKAHRLSYEIHKGKIPTDLCVCHSCDNRWCVNPEHLWLGTRQQNTADMMMKERDWHPHGESISWAKLTDKNVKRIRKIYTKRGFYTLQKLADTFHVRPSTIYRIIKRSSWKHVIE